MRKTFAVVVCIIMFASQLYAQNPPCPSRTIDIIDMGGWGTSYTYCGKVFLEFDSELKTQIRSLNDGETNRLLNSANTTDAFGTLIVVGGALALGWGLAMLGGGETEELDENDTPAYLDSKNSPPFLIAGGAALLLGLIVMSKATSLNNQAVQRYNEVVGNRVKVSYRNDTKSHERIWNVGYSGMAF